MSGKRDSNIELLRIITMILIIGHHYVHHGLYNTNLTGSVTNLWSNGRGTARVIASLLYPGGRVGNYIFFMLSGYFLINRTESIKIRKVISIVIFYGITLSLVTGLLGLMGILPEGVRFSGIINNSVIGLFTPITGVWWFITAYILLMLLVPIINGYISKLTLKGYFASLALIWLPFSVIDYMFNSPLIEIEMAVYFYMLGGFLRKSNLAKKHRSLIWALLSAIAWGCSAGLNYLANAGADNNIVFKVIAKFSTGLDAGVASLLAACFIFCTFASLRMPYISWINRLAESTLSVYMIHEFPTIRYFLWNNIFKVAVAYQKTLFPLYAAMSIAVVFVGCIAIDQIRVYLAKRYGEIIHNKLKEFAIEGEIFAR